MIRTRSLRRLAFVACGTILAIGAPSRLSAQGAADPRPYVSGSVFADVKRFSGDLTDNNLDGEAVGGGITAGTAIGTKWGLQIGLDLPRSTESVRERSVILRSSTITLRSITRTRAVTVATLVRFRHSAQGRIQLGYLAGVSFLRLRQQFETVASDTVPSSLIPRPVQSVDYAAAPTVGIDAQLALSGHISVVPAIHVAAFRTQAVSGILVRPRVDVRWTF